MEPVSFDVTLMFAVPLLLTDVESLTATIGRCRGGLVVVGGVVVVVVGRWWWWSWLSVECGGRGGRWGCGRGGWSELWSCGGWSGSGRGGWSGGGGWRYRRYDRGGGASTGRLSWSVLLPGWSRVVDGLDPGRVFRPEPSVCDVGVSPVVSGSTSDWAVGPRLRSRRLVRLRSPNQGVDGISRETGSGDDDLDDVLRRQVDRGGDDPDDHRCRHESRTRQEGDHIATQRGKPSRPGELSHGSQGTGGPSEPAECNFHERARHLRVELDAGKCHDLLAGGLGGLGALVGPAARHDVVGVGDCDDASPVCDVLARQTVRVTRAVVSLVVVLDGLGPVAEPGDDRCDQPDPVDRVLADLVPLVVIEFAVLVEDLT